MINCEVGICGEERKADSPVDGVTGPLHHGALPGQEFPTLLLQVEDGVGV
jgi:hypothetical protein